jgi:hypothetical protein
VPLRRPLVRLMWWIGGVAAGGLAVLGGLGLRGSGLVAVGIAGVLAASTAVGIARDAPGHDRRSVLEYAVQAACWTVGILLALAGLAVLAGGLVALVAGVAGLTAWLLSRAARSGRSARSPAAPPRASAAEVLHLPAPPSEGASPVAVDGASAPASALTTPALGREWLRTSVALGGRLAPADREALVRRREATLDELERRDPAGFARWLADGPRSDPADYVRGRPVQEDPTAGTDAA